MTAAPAQKCVDVRTSFDCGCESIPPMRKPLEQPGAAQSLDGIRLMGRPRYPHMLLATDGRIEVQEAELDQHTNLARRLMFRGVCVKGRTEQRFETGSQNRAATRR
jgi:hypothetical protein